MSTAFIIDTTKAEGRAAVLAFFDGMAGPRRTAAQVIASAEFKIAQAEALIPLSRPETVVGLQKVIARERELIAAVNRSGRLAPQGKRVAA